MNEWVAISLMLGIFSIAFSVLFYFSQKSNGKSARCYFMSFKRHYWILLFNSSQRAIVKDDMIRPFSVENMEIRHSRIVKTRRVESPRIIKVDKGIQLDFEYMDYGAFFIVEIVMNPGYFPWLKGVFRDGDFTHPSLWVGRLSHSNFIPLLGAACIFFLVLPIVVLGDIDFTFEDVPSSVLTITFILLCVLLVYGLANFLPISNGSFREAYRTVRRRKGHLRKCLIERWMRRTGIKFAESYKRLFKTIRQFFRFIESMIISALNAVKTVIDKLKIRFEQKRKKTEKNQVTDEGA